MNLYIYRDLVEQPVIRSLLLWQTTGSVDNYYQAAAGLLATRQGLSEYLASQLLAWAPPAEIADIQAYFDSDIQQLFDRLLAYDWSAAASQAGLLPLPASAKAAAGLMELDSDCWEQDYLRTRRDLMNAASAAMVGNILQEFFRRYATADEARYAAFAWQDGHLQGVEALDPIRFSNLAALGSNRAILINNTAAFLAGQTAHDVLLVGASGTGKSSSVKAVFNEFRANGLKLVELFKEDIADLPKLLEELAERRRRYIIFIDDLSFDSTDRDYKALKVALDGQIAQRPANVLIYATSNRVHLIRESFTEREGPDDVHANDTLQEKMALAERFGIRLYYSALSQPEYLEVVELLLQEAGLAYNEAIGREAIAWEMLTNGRSGRTARQFVTEYRLRLAQTKL
ncbi:MAG: ATP-binding protein [Actinomycetia bacterium]|nr:ATP-binding protein [Actinomycetes bacterium]